VTDKTLEAVRKQIKAMGCEVFEVGLFKPTATGKEPVMLPRTWDAEALLRSVSWLKHQNRDGRNIYIRPSGEHNLSLVDDLTAASVGAMRKAGFTPALVVQTSPGNFQAWVKHPEILDKEAGTAAARALAQQFGGDPGAADWRHFGRLSGYTNRKDKYRASDGLYPFVRLMESSGTEYDKGKEFISIIRTQVEMDRAERLRIAEAARSARSDNDGLLKSIDMFRADPKYAGDGTRVDLAYAVYAVSHGAADAEITAALYSRDLRHKGSQKRQDDYVRRTIQKALAASKGEALSR
jgi:RepB DNA-primase from phage plasmid